MLERERCAKKDMLVEEKEEKQLLES